MMAFVEVSSDFGYIVVTVILSIILVFVLSVKVGAARKKYGVKYPTMYSDNSVIFNCIQRAHQNTLENFPTFLILLLLGGVFSPKLNAVGGVIYLLGRAVYARGYSSGEPSKRNHGAFGYIGLLILLINTIRFAAFLLMA